MRSIKSELLSIMVVWVVPVAIMVGFPHSVFFFSPKASMKYNESSAAFVMLTRDREIAVLEMAKSQLMRNVKHAKIDLFVSDLPEYKEPEMFDLEMRPNKEVAFSMEVQMPPFLPSRAAELPVQVDAAVIVAKPMFPREEMLRIDNGEE